MFSIGTTVEHSLSNKWQAIEVVQPNPAAAPAFVPGMVIIKRHDGKIRGLSPSLEFAEKMAKMLGANQDIHFPFTPHEDMYTYRAEMTMNDAIVLASLTDTHLWARPISWSGSGSALCVRDDDINRVPGPRGSYLSYMVTVTECVGSWEVVAPEIVLGEIERNASAFA